MNVSYEKKTVCTLYMYMMTTSHFPLYKTESNATPILQLYTTLCPEDRKDILRKNGNEVEI